MADTILITGASRDGRPSPSTDSVTSGAGNHREDSLNQAFPQGKQSDPRATYVRINQADRSWRRVPVLRDPRRHSEHGARGVAPEFVARLADALRELIG
jgi:hypothetical protein